ncbi:MAG: OmpA family protein [Myxococcales bacterium]|nr:OmpA family protein [Myxococcales bacterium]
MTTWSRILAGALCALWATAAVAQDVQNFRPAPGTWGGFSVEGAKVPKHLEFVPSLVLNYGKQPLVYRDTAGDVDREIVSDLATGNLLLTLGVLERLELSVDVPLHYTAGEVVEAKGEDGISIGDVRFLPKLRLFGLEQERGFGAAIAVPVSFPTGNDNGYVGDGQIVANPKLILEARGAGVRLATNGGIRVRPNERTVGDLEVGTEVTYGAMLGVELGTENVVAMGEVFGAAAIGDIKADSHSNPLEALLGLRIFVPGGPVFTLGGGTGLIADYGSPLWRVLLGFAWHNRVYDRDGDGLLDEVDKCPDDPEDKDGFQDEDGCPDPDNDQDTILDVVDACQLDPEDHDDWEDADGCPDPDNDNDKILDVDDKCPNEPETVNQWQDQDGCPDEVPDTDGDGLLDPVDKCPQQPEDKDGFEDEDGCPDPDNDQDGLLDTVDQCPNQPETRNGFEDQDGCPDERPTPTLVRVTKQKIEILEKVFFHTNKTSIKPESFNVLQQVAEVLVQNPQIKRVRIEGHTDSVGKDAYNLKLSQGRAESVRKFLTDRGVDVSRLDAVGFGETMPIADNSTSDGRAENRRVEFTIMEQE